MGEVPVTTDECKGRKVGFLQKCKMWDAAHFPGDDPKPFTSSQHWVDSMDSKKQTGSWEEIMLGKPGGNDVWWNGQWG